MYGLVDPEGWRQHRLILVIPELSETVFYQTVSVTKPNRSQYIIQNKCCLARAPDRRR